MGGFLAVGMLIISMAMVMEIAAAATHVVGDSMGWRVPVNDPSAYANWASQQRFAVGDVLVFNFPTGQHDVARVTKAAFDGCNSTTPISLNTTGPVNITLSSPGEEHFICTFGQHCLGGQKLAVSVTAANSSSPSPSPSPLPGTTPPPSSAPTSPSSAPAPSPSSMTSPPSPSPGGGGAGAPTGSSPAPEGSVPPGPSGSGSPPPNTPPGVILPPPGGATPPPAPNAASATTSSSIFAIFVSVAVGIGVY